MSATSLHVPTQEDRLGILGHDLGLPLLPWELAVSGLHWRKWRAREAFEAYCQLVYPFPYGSRARSVDALNNSYVRLRNMDPPPPIPSAKRALDDGPLPPNKKTIPSLDLASQIPSANGHLDAALLSEPWAILNSTLQFRSNNAQFWMNTTGRMYAKLLQYAGYTPTEQYRELIFYALFVAPELGLAPDANGKVQGWKSTGTPDHTPIDFSWEWGPEDRATIRYSFEPIGKHAGTAMDPLNRKTTNNWIAKLQRQNMIPDLDLEWYNHFTSQILPPEDMERPLTSDTFIEETTPKAGTVVALDIEKSGPVMKMYIYPGLRARELGITNLQMVQQAIRSLPSHQYDALNVEPVLDYLEEGTVKYGFETGILGIDCLKPENARIKIYVRAPHTTSEYLMDALTLGARMPLKESSEAIADLRDFWDAFLSDAPDVLPPEAPGRASPGFYYTVGCGKQPSPKLYISPTYFCKSDADVLARLKKFFSTRRTDGMMDNYEQALKDIFDAQTLASRCGSHYYVGCALHKNQLRVVTYLSPQTFTCEQDIIAARGGKVTCPSTAPACSDSALGALE